jgi:tetratricopeptide (TPR) repeat protein
METEMAGLTLEQQREIPGLIAGAAQRIHGFLAATPQEKEIIRPGEFCLDPGFYKDLNLETTTIIYKTLKHEVEHGDPHMFRAEFFSRAGEEALIRFINLGDTYALKRAVAYGSLAVYHVVERMPERGIVISAFARTLRQRWGLSNERGHLDEAIYFFRKTIDLEPEEETNRPAHFDDLAGALLSRYKELHHLEDFDEARRSFELAVSFQHPARPNFQSGLGQLLSERAKFEHPQDLQAFDEGITTLKVALEYLTDQFKGSIGMIYYHLGEAYMARYFASHAAEDWQRATEAFDETITRIKPISQNYLSSRCIVAGVYSDMFARFQTLEFSAKAESLYRLALTSYPDNVVVMASLAEQLRARATITMSQVSLNESVELIERAVQKTGDSESALPPRLEVQAKAFSDRFVLLGNLSDIDGAISALWRSLEALGLSDRDRWKHWKLLAHCLLVRYENTQEINDLQNAESAILSAVELDHHTSKSKSECLRISGKISFAKYNLDRNPTDLEKSINIYQQCIDLADREDQDVWICLNDLGNALLEKFETSKSNQDLQAAATSYQTALEKLRSSRTSSAVDNEAILLTGLGNVQFRQFKEWDRTADLDTAISYYQKSVDATSEFNARIASRAATLSFALQSRFDITHRIEDLEDAKRRLDAVAELPLHLPSTSRSYIENRIGTVYLRFFFHTHDSKYLDSAAVHFRKALSSGCSERAFNMSAASNLAKTLGHKCNMTKNDTDITAAITQFASLLRLAKQTDPEMGTIGEPVRKSIIPFHLFQKPNASEYVGSVYRSRVMFSFIFLYHTHC